MYSGLKFRSRHPSEDLLYPLSLSLSGCTPLCHCENTLNPAEPRNGNSDCDQSASAASDLLLLGGTIKLTSAKCVSDLLCTSIIVFHRKALVCFALLPMRNERTVGSLLHEYLVPFPCLWITSSLAWIFIEINGRSSFRPFLYIILLGGEILNQIDRSFLLTARWQIRRMSIRSHGERRDEQMEIQFDSISGTKVEG